MAYRIKRSESVGAATQRILSDELTTAADELVSNAMSPADAVHQARKRCKRCRGMLRLVRIALPSVFETENACIRDIARRLATTRDADAMLESIELLRRDSTELTDRDLCVAVSTSLSARRQEWHRDAEAPCAVDEVQTLLREAAARLRCVELAESGWSAIGPGLKQTYAQCVRLQNRIRAELCDDLVWHELRKSVKNHWYHVRLLQGIRPRAMKRRAAQLRLLSESLGRDHDFGELLRLVFSHPDILADSSGHNRFLDLVQRAQLAEKHQACGLASEVLWQSPERLTKGFHREWKHWRR